MSFSAVVGSFVSVLPLAVLLIIQKTDGVAIPLSTPLTSFNENSQNCTVVQKLSFINISPQIKLKEFVVGHLPVLELEPYLVDSVNAENMLIRSIKFMSDVKLVWPPTNESNGITRLKPAGCKLAATLISLRPGKDHKNAKYTPNLIRLNRCSGKRNNKTGCLPTEVQLRRFKVAVTENYGTVLPNKATQKSIALLEHLKCSQQCIVKKEDCREDEKYNRGECACECKIVKDCEAESKASNLTKTWNRDTCSCECPNKCHNCSTGHAFDHNTCACKWISNVNEIPSDSTS